MAEAFNMLYRLFAPLLVVILIIVGVDLSSGLIKNTQEKQTAISIAYAASCPAGSVPAEPLTCPNKKDGKCLPTACKAVTKGGTVDGFFLPQDCCKAGNWPGADGKAATAANSSNPLSSALSGQGVTKMLSGLLEKIMGGGGEGGGDTQQPQEQKLNPPICKNLSVTPTLPLEAGESATLIWTLDGGDPTSVVVSPGVGLVTTRSIKVAPGSSTTYTVIAKNNDGSSTCPKVRVYVGPRDIEDGDTTSSEYNSYDGDVLIWDDSGTTDNYQNTAPNSTYDNVADGVSITNTNDNSNYYDFLTELASDISDGVSTEEEVPENVYYYDTEDNITDWELIEGALPDWTEIDTINEVGVESGLYADEYDYYEDPTNNSNGLTNEEIYGIWNRPQSPATGGLGLSSEYGSGQLPIVDTSPEEDAGILGRITGWFKDTFCVWCDGNSSQIGEGMYVAALSIFKDSFTPVPKEGVQSQKEKVVNKDVITKGSVYYKNVRIGCNQKRTGAFLSDEMNVNLVVTDVVGAVKESTNSTSIVRAFTLGSENNSVSLAVNSCEKQSDNTYLITTAFQSYGNKGHSQTVTKKIACDIPIVSVVDEAIDGGTQDIIVGLKSIFLPGKSTLKNNLGVSIEVPKQFVVFCGLPKAESGEVRKDEILKEYCANNTSVQCPDTTNQQCKTKDGRVGKLGVDGTCTSVTVGQNTGVRLTAAQKCVQDGGTVVGKNAEGRVMCSKQQKTKNPNIQGKQQTTALKKAQDALKKAQSSAKKQGASTAKKQSSTAAQQSAAQKKAAAAAAEEKTWAQAILAKLRGTSQPQCVSLNSNKTKIDEGEEIILNWIVTGATKIVITPKVELVTGNGKRVAKASPQSSISTTRPLINGGNPFGYTLIATNSNGDEHRCYSKPIIVDEGAAERRAACVGKSATVNLTIEPDEVTRNACASGQTTEECDDDWLGEEVAVKWDLSCVDTCTLSGPDGLSQSGIDETDDDELVGMLRKTSTFKISCTDWDGDSLNASDTVTVTQE